MVSRYQDWLHQAQRDLAHARRSRQGADYEWACFAAQQAAEKALKALLGFHNYEARGHSLLFLLEKAGEFLSLPAGMTGQAQELDRHYIQSRYPNAFAEGYPQRFYNDETAQRCVDYAAAILGFVEAAVS